MGFAEGMTRMDVGERFCEAEALLHHAVHSQSDSSNGVKRKGEKRQVE